jgi:hypothetical protein
MTRPLAGSIGGGVPRSFNNLEQQTLATMLDQWGKA